MDKKIRILIADDNPVLREGLKSVLSPIPIFDIVGEASDGIELLNLVDRLLPDLVLMDISMPRMGGIVATREIKQKWPETKILVFSIHESPDYQKAALRAGADGYILKDSSPAELIQSIKDILDEKQGLYQTLFTTEDFRI